MNQREKNVDDFYRIVRMQNKVDENYYSKRVRKRGRARGIQQLLAKPFLLSRVRLCRGDRVIESWGDIQRTRDESNHKGVCSVGSAKWKQRLNGENFLNLIWSVR